MDTAIKALTEEIKAKTLTWRASMDKAQAEGYVPTAEDVEALTAGNKELSELHERKASLQKAWEGAQELDAKLKVDEDAARKALEQATIDNRLPSGKPDATPEDGWVAKAAKALSENNSYSQHNAYSVPVGIKGFCAKTLFTEGPYSASGFSGTYSYPVEPMRDPAMFTPAAVRPVQFFNTIRQIPTMLLTDTYDEEQAITDPAAADFVVAEGGAYGEGEFSYIERVNQIRGVGRFVPASKWVLDDVPMMENLLEMRLAEQMARGLDNALMNWAGGTNQFRGILHYQDASATPLNIPSFAKGADENLQDAISRAIEHINGPGIGASNLDSGVATTGGQGMADAIYVTVATYWDWVRQQDALGNYMVTAGLREAPALRCGGVPVMQCQVLPAGNILVMDRSFTHIRDRQSVEVYWMERVDTSGNQSKPTGQRMVVADARCVITHRRMGTAVKITGA